LSDRCVVEVFIVALLCMATGWSAQASGAKYNEAAGVCENTKGTEGGPCSYRLFPGQAVITRVIKTAASTMQARTVGGPGYEGFEVWFRFVPQSLPRDQAVVPAGRELLFTLRNGWYVGPRYLAKYGLSPGKTVSCVMAVIQKGSCTPLRFDFPTIPNEDYFETTRR
jgi:hypothetical protein